MSRLSVGLGIWSARMRRSWGADWIEGHIELVGLAIVALGFILRLVSATRSYLDPDEALHYLIAHQASLIQVYRASLTNAHPFFFFVLLHFWRLLGSSELVLRLMSVLVGTAACWVGFKWLAYRFGGTTGLVGLLLLTFCPTLVSLSAEVRQYAVLLLSMTVALYTLERGLREGSERMLLWFFLALLSANLTHYSAVWFTIAVGLYALTRIVRERLSSRWIWHWVGLQVAIIALWVFQYLTHIRVLRGSGMEQFAREGWLQMSYYHPGQKSFLQYVAEALGSLFAHLFSSRFAGLLASGLFLAGVVTLLARHRLRSGPSARNHDPRGTEDSSFGIMLIASITVSVIAALAGLYPLGGSRHSTFLVLFIVSGISVLLGRLARRRLGAVFLAAAVIVPIWQGTATTARTEYLPDQDLDLMTSAVNYVRGSIPRGSLLLVDCQTAILLGYYLGGGEIDDQTMVLQSRFVHRSQSAVESEVPIDTFTELSYGGYRVVSSTRWNFTPDHFWSELRAMKQHYRIGPATPVWVVDGGWATRLSSDLPRLYPQYSYRGLRAFGRSLSVFQVQEVAQ